MDEFFNTNPMLCTELSKIYEHSFTVENKTTLLNVTFDQSKILFVKSLRTPHAHTFTHLHTQ